MDTSIIFLKVKGSPIKATVNGKNPVCSRFFFGLVRHWWCSLKDIDSNLRFLLLIADALFEGDPFSHPSGSSALEGTFSPWLIIFRTERNGHLPSSLRLGFLSILLLGLRLQFVKSFHLGARLRDCGVQKNFSAGPCSFSLTRTLAGHT